MTTVGILSYNLVMTNRKEKIIIIFRFIFELVLNFKFQNSLEKAKEEADKVRKDLAANNKKISEKQDQVC